MGKHYEVKLEQDNLAPGAEVVVHGLGTLKNGKVVEFDQEYVDSHFRVVNQTSEAVYKDGVLHHYDEKLGPTLKQAAKNMPGTVTVDLVDDAPQVEDKVEEPADTKPTGLQKKEGEK
jgi:hypothetical protein